MDSSDFAAATAITITIINSSIKAGSGKNENEIVGYSSEKNALVMAIKAAPEKNEANKVLVSIFSFPSSQRTPQGL